MVTWVPGRPVYNYDVLTSRDSVHGSDRSPIRLRFGQFELDVAANQLTREGRKVEIQGQPLRIVALLAQHAGELITREELQHQIWTGDTFVDFESSLKTALKKARQALGDDAGNPRFIETIPRRGYRFIAPVAFVLPPAPAVAPAPPPTISDAPQQPEPAPTLPAPTRSWWVAAGFTGGIFVALAAMAIWWVSLPKPPVLDRIRPFTNTRGTQAHPAFSPNQPVLAFDWKSPQDLHTSIYVQRLDATSPVRFTRGSEEEFRPVWSPDGSRIAFLRNVDENTLGIFSTPVVGTETQKWTEFQRGASPWFDWSGDGKWFVIAEPVSAGRSPSIVLISLASGERRVLTHPPAAWRGDSRPIFSRDSKRVIFRRTQALSSAEDIYEIPVSGGEPKRLTFDNRMISGFAFTLDNGLLFSSKRAGSITSLWWLAPGGSALTRVTTATFDAVSPAVSSDGRHISFAKALYDVNIWRVNADGSGAAAPWIDSELPDTSPEFSPDGRRLAFHSIRSGASEIWVSDASGANPVRLTDGRGAALGNPRWSPDGKWIAFEWHPNDKAEISLIPSDGSAPARALVADGRQNSTPAWSHDGRFVYFSSRLGEQMDIRKIPMQGGAASVVAPREGFGPAESPDGKYLYYFRSGAVWRVPLENGNPRGAESKEVGTLGPGDWGNWVPVNQGIYYIQRRPNQEAAIQLQPFNGGPPQVIHVLQRSPIYGGRGLAVSPDGKTILFAQVDQNDSNLFVQ